MASALGSYAGIAARTLATIRRKGAPVTFRFDQGDGTYLADIDFEQTAKPVTVAGYAVRDDTVASLGSTPAERVPDTEQRAEAPTLLFAPSAPGQLPEVGMLGTWGGHTYAVKSVDPIAPAGAAIAARISVSR